MKTGSFRYNGKLLLTAEYFVLDGVRGLALPAKYGQQFTVSADQAEDSCIIWKAFDASGELWIDRKITPESLSMVSNKEGDWLLKALKVVEVQTDIFAPKTKIEISAHLDFNRTWGLGSSSTLIAFLAQYFERHPWRLLDATFKGSGYDVAAAMIDHPFYYSKTSGSNPEIEVAEFDPPFKDQLFFVYLGKKQDSREGIEHYQSRKNSGSFKKIGKRIAEIGNEIASVQNLSGFEALLIEHEELIASALHLDRAKQLHFSDYWGEVKSLGAWGGDFVLITNDRSRQELQEYLLKNGFRDFLSYDEMVLNGAFFNPMSQHLTDVTA